MEDGTRTEGRTFFVHAIHLMRTVQATQTQYSAMADSKASILMGATFVIFTITIGQARGTSTPIPLLILGGSAFLSAIFALLALLPTLGSRKSPDPPNLLFFGTFSQMPEEDFIEAITARLEDEETVYRTIARDIHQQGRILQTRKYRMLAHAYRVLLAGLVASSVAFALSYLR